MKETLETLVEGRTLSSGEAKDALTTIAGGETSDALISAFLTIFLMRDITPGELLGFREALLELSIPVKIDSDILLDVCGTGGDGKDTFNISTAAAFVVAGAGITVIKHGNYGVSSACGSSNVLEYLGYHFSNRQDKLRQEAETAGITYLHAPLFHPAMKKVAPVRKALRMKTFFNILGPMVNPARPTHQLIGVYDRKVQDLYASVYKNTGIRFKIIWATDGYDEISLTSDVRILSRDTEKILSPGNLGFGKWHAEDLAGGKTVKESADIFLSVLRGEGTPAEQEVVLANAAMALKLCRPDKTFNECKEQALESIASGKAMQSLTVLLKQQS
ncbi:MAG: anthranilate phosphoribosyltransferase [Chlorobi bacterium]|nr:anthranilate phosphoribosyltransferase [Chlorobiota bacterium]